jgi:hypothetical protein
MAFTISSIIKIIIEQLDMPAVPIIIYINSYSLYKYLVKLNTIKEKHLIINIIAIQQSYKYRELFKI